MNQLAHYRNLLEAIANTNTWIQNIKAQSGTLTIVTKPNANLNIGDDSVTVTKIEIPLSPEWGGIVGIYFDNPADEQKYGEDLTYVIYDNLDTPAINKLNQLIYNALDGKFDIVIDPEIDLEPLNGEGYGIRVNIDDDIITALLDEIVNHNEQLLIYLLKTDYQIINLVDEPSTEFLNNQDVKNIIIVGILKDMKTGNAAEASGVVNHLISQNVEWPELTTIKRSLDSLK